MQIQQFTGSRTEAERGQLSQQVFVKVLNFLMVKSGFER